MSTKLYDPAQLIVTWGPNLISGFAPDTFLEAERDEDAFSKEVGADGEVARARNKNRSGSVTITLGQWSGSNDVFSTAALNDELTGTGSMPLLVKDLNGTTVLSALNAWVKKKAPVENAKTQKERVWVLDCDLLLGNVGGSNPGP